MSTVEEINMESIHRCTEEFMNQKNISLLPELFTEDFINHPNEGEDVVGLDILRKATEMTLHAFPDFHYEIVEMFAVEDKIAVVYRQTGTFKGEYMGIQPTGKKFNIRSIYVCRMKDGKQAEAWGCNDLLTAFIQLGVIPPPFVIPE